MRKAVEIIRSMTGEAPLGWYTGRDSPNTRRLVVEHGGFRFRLADTHYRYSRVGLEKLPQTAASE